jgi:hypothetical protein
MVSIKMKDTSSTTISQSILLRLPTELRLEIYTLVLGTCSSPHRPYDIHRNSKSQLSLDILLVNRQIYSEAHLLPFQLNVFDFNKWNGTGIPYCRLFLRKLQAWQAGEVRHVMLGVMGLHLMSGRAEGWIGLCRIFGVEIQKGVGLRSLRLTISGCLFHGGAELFDVNVQWVREGLKNLKFLDLLEVVIASEKIDQGLLGNFKKSLQQVLHEITLVIQVVEEGIVTTIL